MIFHFLYKSLVTSLVSFLRVGDFGDLGDNGGERFVGMLDFVFLLYLKLGKNHE